MVKAKDQIKQADCSNCVYQVKCSDCPAEYIGQTSRQLKTRMTEHKRKLRFPPKDEYQYKKLERDSAIALHALAENHTVDFDNARVLQKGFHSYQERMYAESFSIHTRQNCINAIDTILTGMNRK